MAKHYLSSQFLALSPEEEAELEYPELRYEPNDDIGPYDGQDYEDIDYDYEDGPEDKDDE